MEDNQMTLNATDFENQVVNLVKAAMSGDEEANDVIVQIIEAAKKGDEQALKVVALIKQLTLSTSDQAEEGAEENTEAMKCGGKVRAKMKAKKSAEKKEEGGEIPEEKCGGTAKKMRKAACKAKKCEEGDKLTDTQKFLLGAKCGGKMKKTKKHEEGGLISLDFSQIDFAKCGKKLKKKEDGGEIAEEKCGGKAKKVKKGEVGVRLPEGVHGQIWSKSKSKSTSSTTVFAKGGNTCPCALKRVGGKIITVDSCTGLPVHKQGGPIKKYQDPAEPIEYNRFGTDFKYDPNTKKFYKHSPFEFGWREASFDEIANMRGSQEFANHLYRMGYHHPVDDVYLDRDDKDVVVSSRTGRFPNINSLGWWLPGDDGNLDYVDGKYVINSGKDNEETLDFSEFYDRYPSRRPWLSRYNRAGYRGEEIPYKDGKAQWDPAQLKYVYKVYRTVSAPATESEESTEGSASASAAPQTATAAATGSSTTVLQGATAATSTGASSQSGSKLNFAEWIKQNAPQYLSYQERKKLAEKYGIQDYKGSLQLNLQMWERMKNDQTLNSQASQEATVASEAVRPVNRIAPLLNPLSILRKIEIPTVNLQI